MNTKKVRPILLPTKNTNSQLEIDDLSVGKLSYESKLYQCKRPQQIILISLEDEKIEVGDKCYHPISKKLKVADTSYHNEFGWKKVIATQSQLSPELIQQLVGEYNNGGMKDFEIEMDELYLYPDGIKSKISRLAPNPKPITEPKLTNGFITVVKKESILYTEEEVEKLLKKILLEEPEDSDQIPMNYFWSWFDIWFEQNKKK